MMSHDSSAPAPQVSFEFFPPKSVELEAALWRAAERLAQLKPLFVSVTYGAGGSTRARTHEIVTHMQAHCGVPAAAHLTCVAATRAEVNDIARSYWQAGIKHIVALRGDPPSGVGTCYTPQADGYAYAADLVAGLQHVAPFEMSVAAYPEKHPEAASLEADLDNLKRKIDAGATRAIAQFCFDDDAFLRFRDKAAAAGIKAPIVPGILPITNYARAVDFSAKCGAHIPTSYHTALAGFDEKSAEDKAAIALDLCRTQCAFLHRAGVQHLHFYTLNRAELVESVCHSLGVK